MHILERKKADNQWPKHPSQQVTTTITQTQKKYNEVIIEIKAEINEREKINWNNYLNKKLNLLKD